MAGSPWFAITVIVALWSAIVGVAVVVLSRRGKRWLPTLLWALPTGVLILPASIGIFALSDRTGDSPQSYATTSEVADSRIAACLPSQATSLSIRAHSGGFLAIFTIEPVEYEAFLDQLWAADGGRSVAPRAESKAVILDELSEDLALRWRSSLPPEWAGVSDASSDRGPASRSGATTRLSYSPSRRSCILERWWW